MKKILSSLLIVSLLSGCGSSTTQETPITNSTEINETETPKEYVKDKEAVIVDSKFFYNQEYSSRYYIEVTNPNTEQWIAQTEISITGYDDEGKVTGAETVTIPFLAQSQTVYVAGSFYDNDVEPAKVDFKISDTYQIAKPKKAHTLELNVKNANEIKDDYGIYNVLAEIENVSDTDLNYGNYLITLLLKQGDDVVYAEDKYLSDELKVGETTVIEFNGYNFPEHDTIEIHAYGWNNGNN